MASTEERLADLEARVAALENVNGQGEAKSATVRAAQPVDPGRHPLRGNPRRDR